jgi:hypothetical protein
LIDGSPLGESDGDLIGVAMRWHSIQNDHVYDSTIPDAQAKGASKLARFANPFQEIFSSSDA